MTTEKLIKELERIEQDFLDEESRLLGEIATRNLSSSFPNLEQVRKDKEVITEAINRVKWQLSLTFKD